MGFYQNFDPFVVVKDSSYFNGYLKLKNDGSEFYLLPRSNEC